MPRELLARNAKFVSVAPLRGGGGSPGFIGWRGEGESPGFFGGRGGPRLHFWNRECYEGVWSLGGHATLCKIN